MTRSEVAPTTTAGAIRASVEYHNVYLDQIQHQREHDRYGDFDRLNRDFRTGLVQPHRTCSGCVRGERDSKRRDLVRRYVTARHLAFAGCLVAALTACGPVPDLTVSGGVVELPVEASGGKRVAVTSVYDGDTFRSGSRSFRILVMDSCEMNTPGGKAARTDARALLSGHTVTVTSEPGHERDRYDRELVYVTLPDGRDFAETMLRESHTAVYAKRSDASEARTAAGRAADVDGRDCG